MSDELPGRRSGKHDVDWNKVGAFAGVLGVIVAILGLLISNSTSSNKAFATQIPSTTIIPTSTEGLPCVAKHWYSGNGKQTIPSQYNYVPSNCLLVVDAWAGSLVINGINPYEFSGGYLIVFEPGTYTGSLTSAGFDILGPELAKMRYCQILKDPNEGQLTVKIPLKSWPYNLCSSTSTLHSIVLP